MASLEGAEAALHVKTAAMTSRPSHRANTKPLSRISVDLAIAVARNQDLAPMPAAEKRHHEMLAVPHGDDHRLVRLYGLVKIGGLDREATGRPHQPKIFGGP